MKQKTITLPHLELMVVELQDKSQGVKFTEKGNLTYFRYDEMKGSYPVVQKIPEGNWQHLGAVNDVSEEKADTIVSRHFMDGCRSYNLYRDYLVSENDGRWLDDSVESLHSLLTANGVVFESRELKWKTFDTQERYEQAQSKVWDRERTHIFIKQK